MKMKYRQIRIFVLPAEGPNWVESVVGKIIAPVVNTPHIHWFWFSRYGEDKGGSSEDCNLDHIPPEYNHDLDPTHNGLWRSIRFRYAVVAMRCSQVEKKILCLLAKSDYAASCCLPYHWSDDLASDRMLVPPHSRQRKLKRARGMAKALHGAAEVFIDCLQQAPSGQFFQEKNSYIWGFGSSMEPLRHLLVNMTGAPTQVVVQSNPNNSLVPRGHLLGEPQVIVEEANGAIKVHGKLNFSAAFEHP